MTASIHNPICVHFSFSPSASDAVKTFSMAVVHPGLENNTLDGGNILHLKLCKWRYAGPASQPVSGSLIHEPWDRSDISAIRTLSIFLTHPIISSLPYLSIYSTSLLFPHLLFPFLHLTLSLFLPRHTLSPLPCLTLSPPL